MLPLLAAVVHGLGTFAAPAPFAPPRWLTDVAAEVLLHRHVGRDLRLGADVCVAPSFGTGNGLFALRDIRAGEYVGRYTGDVLGDDAYEERLGQGQTSGRYAFCAGPGIVIDAERPEESTFLRYVNHSRLRANLRANVLFHQSGLAVGVVFFTCVKDVRAGQELYFDYGDAHFGQLAPFHPQRLLAYVS